MWHQLVLKLDGLKSCCVVAEQVPGRVLGKVPEQVPGKVMEGSGLGGSGCRQGCGRLPLDACLGSGSGQS